MNASPTSGAIAVASLRVQCAAAGGKDRRASSRDRIRGSLRKMTRRLVFSGSSGSGIRTYRVHGRVDDRAMQMGEGRTATAASRPACRPAEATCNNNRPTHGALKRLRRLHRTRSIDLRTSRWDTRLRTA